jgi:hypothetical protein
VISVSADSMTNSPAPGCRGRPRRASDSTSAASNRLVRPSSPARRRSTPRLTYEYSVAGLIRSRRAASPAPIHSVTRASTPLQTYPGCLCAQDGRATPEGRGLVGAGYGWRGW